MTILNALLNPQVAVILFFVLSGFVLAQSLAGIEGHLGRRVAGFYLRRSFRIVPVMWIALLVSYGLAKLNRTLPAGQVSIFYAANYIRVSHALDLLSNLFLVRFDISGVTWTMRVELLGSLLMPVFVWVGLRSSRPQHLAVLVVLYALCNRLLGGDFRFLICFYTGTLLAFDDVLKAWSFRPGLMILAGVGISILLRLATALQNSPNVDLCIATLASTLLLLGVLGRRSKYDVLDSRVCRSLGRVSYSFYLFHPPVLAVCAFIVYSLGLFTKPDIIVALVIFASTAAVSYVVSSVSYAWIEQPSIAFGKKLSKYLGR